MNAQIIEDILNQAKVDKNGRIMNKGRLNDMLHSEHLKAVKNCSIPNVVERVSRMKDDSGREGCTYGDTDYDSMTVVYGYNLAIDDVTDTLGKL